MIYLNELTRTRARSRGGSFEKMSHLTCGLVEEMTLDKTEWLNRIRV